MKNTKLAVAILGLLAAAAGPAAAQDKGIYLGGSAGYAQYKDTCKRLIIPCDGHDSAWRLFSGYQFNRYLSAELGYADLGAVTGSGSDPVLGTGTFVWAVKAWDLSAHASVPVAGGLSALGRLGAYRARTTEDQESTGFTPFHNAGTNSGFTYGAGIGYTLWKIGLRAEWQRYENVGAGATREDDLDVFSIALLWRF